MPEVSEKGRVIKPAFNIKQLFNNVLIIFQHPGGETILLENSGEDSTQAFEDAGHSSDARELLKDFLIGDLAKVISQFIVKIYAFIIRALKVGGRGYTPPHRLQSG